MTASLTVAVLASSVASAHTRGSAAGSALAVTSFLAYDYIRNPLSGIRFLATQQKTVWLLSPHLASAWIRIGALLFTVAALSVYTEDFSSGKRGGRGGDEKSQFHRRLLLPLFDPVFFAEARAPGKSRDFYRILGLRRDATTSDIDKAYRRLARQYHPDASDGDKEKFLNIARAHEVLRDEEQRKKYDAFGEAGLNDGSGPPQSSSGGVPFDFADIFSGAFGGGGGGGAGPNIKFTFTTDGGQQGFSGGFGNFFSRTKGAREDALEESLYEDEEDVAELGSQGLQRQLDSREFAFFLNLYDPRCRPCRQSKSEYVKAAQKFRGIIPFGAVNCNRFRNSRACRDAGHYPTLLLYPPDLQGRPVEYRGDRSAASLVRFLTEEMPSAAKMLTSFTFEQWMAERPELPKVVLFTDKKGISPLFKYISYQMRRQLAFGVVFKDQAELVNVFRIHLQRQRQREASSRKHTRGKRLPVDLVFPSLLAIDDNDQLSGEWINVQGHVDQELLTLTLSRVAAKARASAGAAFKELTARRLASGECSPDDSQFCFVLLVPDELAARGEPAALFATMHALAEKFKRDPLKLCWVNKDLQAQLAAAFEIPSTSTLAFVAYRPKRRKYEVLQTEVSTATIESFIDNVISGGKQLTRKIQRTPILVASSRAESSGARDEL